MRLATLILALLLQGITIPGPGNTHAGFPPNIYNGLQIWYRADHTLCSGGSCTDGQFVTTWTDGSPNQNNAAGCTPAAVYHVAQVNGQPAVTFVNDCYSFRIPVNLQTASTIFIVYRLADVVTNDQVLLSGNNNSLEYIFNESGGPYEQSLSKLGVGILVNGTAMPDMSWHQGTGTYDGATATLLLDGAPDGTNAAGVAITANETGIGGTFGGQVAEIIIYNRVLSGGELASVRSYLFTRYGV